MAEGNEKEYIFKDEKRKKGKRPWEPIKLSFVAHINELIRGGPNKSVGMPDGDGGKAGMP